MSGTEAAPPVIDSAIVRAYAVVSADVVFTGKQRVLVGGVKVGPASRLAAAFNWHTDDYLLLLCNDSWESFAAIGAPVLEEALDQAERWYAGISRHWIRTAYTAVEDRRHLEEYHGGRTCSFCDALPPERQRMFPVETAWICNICVVELNDELTESERRTRASGTPIAEGTSPVSWEHFAAAAPGLASFGKERLEKRIAYLATVRPDSSPRVHPVSPLLAHNHLFVYMEPTSPKAHDLRRDARYSMHCTVENNSGGQGEFLIRGHAAEVNDSRTRERAFDSARAIGYNPKERYVLFELNVEEALATVYEEGEPTRSRWKANQ